MIENVKNTRKVETIGIYKLIDKNKPALIPKFEITSEMSNST